MARWLRVDTPRCTPGDPAARRASRSVVIRRRPCPAPWHRSTRSMWRCEGWVSSSRRVRVPAAQRRPPLVLEPGVEGGGVEGAQDVAADALVVLEHEGQLGLEACVGADVDVTEQVRVVVEGGGVVPGVARLQAHPVEVVEVLGAEATDLGHGRPSSSAMAPPSVQLRPFREEDLAFVAQSSTEPEFSLPFEWGGYRSVPRLRRRWEEDWFLEKDPANWRWPRAT